LGIEAVPISLCVAILRIKTRSLRRQVWLQYTLLLQHAKYTGGSNIELRLSCVLLKDYLADDLSSARSVNLNLNGRVSLLKHIGQVSSISEINPRIPQYGSFFFRSF
jgi:hypothetical protein